MPPKFPLVLLTLSILAASGCASTHALRPAQVDQGKVATVDDWAQRHNATVVWNNYPQAPRTEE